MFKLGLLVLLLAIWTTQSEGKTWDKDSGNRAFLYFNTAEREGINVDREGRRTRRGDTHQGKETQTHHHQASERSNLVIEKPEIVKSAAYIDINKEPGRMGDMNGCHAKIECLTKKYSDPNTNYVIESIKLYRDVNNDGSTTLLALADKETDWIFRDQMNYTNAGAVAFKGIPQYIIYPITVDEIGEYTCEISVRLNPGYLRVLGIKNLTFDQCCKPCATCDNDGSGVWDSSGWHYSCRNCTEIRNSSRCLTERCTGKSPAMARRCFEDGLCDETSSIKISTENEGGYCSARIQCLVGKRCDVRSVKLYHLWNATELDADDASFFAGLYSGLVKRIYTEETLLAKAVRMEERGSFQVVYQHPNGYTVPVTPSVPELCQGTYDCREFYTFQIDQVNQANVGAYACVINDERGSLKWPAKLSFSDTCPPPDHAPAEEENCEQNCFKKYVEGNNPNYIAYYCRTLCMREEEEEEEQGEEEGKEE